MKRTTLKYILTTLIFTSILTTTVFADNDIISESEIPIQSTSNINNLFPGESAKIYNTDFDIIENTNDENIIVCVDFMSATKGYVGNPNYAYFEPKKFQKDYDYYSEPGKVLFKNRLSKVMNLEMTEDNGWIKIGTKYFTLIEGNSEKELNDATFSILPELGGRARNKFTLLPERSYNRNGWEQGSYFNLAYNLKTINSTQESFINVFGQDVFDELTSKMSENWFN